jgi:NADPH:quinone reductase-like Zn-dependent oxidoreductase
MSRYCKITSAPTSAGAAGRFAVQFAKQIGAHVTATGSSGSKDLLADLGADVFLDYRTERFESLGRTFDLVLDFVGGESLDRSFSIVKPGGMVIVSCRLPTTILDLLRVN